MSAVSEVGASPDAPRERMGLVVDAARAAIAQEFQIAERLDAKARNQVTVAAAWYGVVQAAAGIVLKSGVHIAAPTKWALLAVAIAGAAGFAGLLVASFLLWRVRDEKDVTPLGLEQMAAAAHDPGRDLETDMLTHYRSVLQRRRRNNVARVGWFRWAEIAWAVCVLSALAEIVFAFVLAARVTS